MAGVRKQVKSVKVVKKGKARTRFGVKVTPKKSKAAKKVPIERLVSLSRGFQNALLAAGNGQELVVVRRSRNAVFTEHLGRIVLDSLTEQLDLEPAPKQQETVDAVAAAFTPDARARALLRGREIIEQDLRDAGGAYSMEEAQALLGHVSRQTVHKKIARGELLSLAGPGRRRVFPTFQFSKEGLMPGLLQVSKAFPSRSGWALLNFLINPDDRLQGKKPIDVLRTGDVDRVVDSARRFGVAGA